MTLEVLISAMHLSDFSIVEKSNVQTDVLIINQTDHDGYEERIINGHRARMISTTQRGLSRSRNMALIHASGDICLLADDDEFLLPEYEQVILSAFNRVTEATIIAFNTNYLGNRLKSALYVITKERQSPRFKSYNSIALAFRRLPVLNTGVYFNVLLGAGSGCVSAGEESAWQIAARKKGLKIYESPDYICTVEQTKSTWFKGYTKKYFYDLGANLSINYPLLKHLFKFYYIWRLRKDCTLSFYQQIKYMNMGMKGFPKGLGYDEYINAQHS